MPPAQDAMGNPEAGKNNCHQDATYHIWPMLDPKLPQCISKPRAVCAIVLFPAAELPANTQEILE